MAGQPPLMEVHRPVVFWGSAANATFNCFSLACEKAAIQTADLNGY
jgi:hypothetical protein